MLLDATQYIGRFADIQGAVAFAGGDIDKMMGHEEMLNHFVGEAHTGESRYPVHETATAMLEIEVI